MFATPAAGSPVAGSCSPLQRRLGWTGATRRMSEKRKRAGSPIKRDSSGSQIPSPGSSNTRALTPPEDHAPAAPKLLQASLDALKLAFRVSLAETELARMARFLDAGEPAGYEVSGEEFELRTLAGRTKKFLLSNAAATVCVGADQDDFCVTVEFRALFLRTTPLDSAVEYAKGLARQFAATTVAEVRVRRADLCADATGLVFTRDDEDHFVTRARTKVRFQAPEKVFTRKRAKNARLTGFVIAPRNPLQVRIYDKMEELMVVQGKDSEKTRTELAAFKAAGWDGSSPVWRVEAQIRTEVLQQLGAGSPEQLAKVLDSLWSYVVGAQDMQRRAWLRLVEPGTSTRMERCRTDARWQVFQSARFVGRSPVERVQGRKGGVAPDNALGALLSLLGASSNLRDPGEEQTPRELILSDFARAAEVIAATPHLLKTYRRRRSSARARYWFPKKALKGAS